MAKREAIEREKQKQEASEAAEKARLKALSKLIQMGFEGSIL
jgi:hypothetical protein